MKLFSPFVSLVLIPQLVTAPLPAAPSEAVLQLNVSAQTDDISIKVVDENGAAVADAAVAVRLPDSGQTGTFADGAHAAVAYTDERGEARLSGVKWSSGPGTVTVRVTATKGSARAGTLFEEKLGRENAAKVAPNVAQAEQAPPLLPTAPVVAVRQPGELAGPASPTPAPPQLASANQPAAVPMVSITHGPTHEKISGTSHKKWIILALVAGAGAGAALALAGKKSSSSAATTSSSTTIGTPTVTIGAP